jgi:hypothetical protein
MTKRGRKPLPRFSASWRPIYRDVWNLVADGMKFIEACREIGRRRGMDWQVVRKRFLKVEEHGVSVRRMVERFNRALNRN